MEACSDHSDSSRLPVRGPPVIGSVWPFELFKLFEVDEGKGRMRCKRVSCA